MRFYFVVFFTLIGSFVAMAQNPLQTRDSLAQQQWVEAKYGQMSLDEKLGQLFMVSIASDQGLAATEQIKNLIVKEHLGGVIFSKGGPVRQAKLTNSFQSVSKVPLLIGMDAEWGLSMRLDSTYAFPWNMTLGAIQDSSIVEKVGYQIGKHAKRLGVHINFAPDLDINTNPKNPIIGNRSFGENRDNVVQKGIAFIQGMERAGVLANGKHFPGHGDTAVDSHHNLPVIPFSRARLDSLELYPFKKVIESGLSSIMVAHLEVPALELKEGLPSSISEQVISGLLREDFGFEGLIFTDALNMKGVSTQGKDGAVELAAFMAGNDMLLMPENVTSAKQKLTKAYENGKLTEQRLAYSVKKILMAKYKAGLNNYAPIDLTNLYGDLNSLENDIVYEEAMEAAITIVKNNLDLLAIKNLENKKIAYVKFGDAPNEAFVKGLKNYADITVVNANSIEDLKIKLKEFNLVIIGLHKSNESPWKAYSFSKSELGWLQEIANERTSNLILCAFAKPYALSDIHSFQSIDAIVMAYQNSAIAQEKTAEVLFGALGAQGKLPVSVFREFPVNTGVETKSLSRLGYSIPERVGLSTEGLGAIDGLVKDGLDSLMFPGRRSLFPEKEKSSIKKALEGLPMVQVS